MQMADSGPTIHWLTGSLDAPVSSAPGSRVGTVSFGIEIGSLPPACNRGNIKPVITKSMLPELCARLAATAAACRRCRRW